jgi:hypothetical protein
MSESNRVISLLVGDGCATGKGTLTFHHAASQREWLEAKIHILEEEGFKVRFREQSSMSYGQMRNFVRAETTATTRGKALRNLLYSTGKKILPWVVATFGFKEWAIIFQDDGRSNKINHYNTIVDGVRRRVECEPFINRYEIATNCYSLDDISLLQESLKNLGIESSVMMSHKKQNLLCISRAESKVAFYKGISPYVVDSMKYKVAAKPTLGYNHIS